MILNSLSIQMLCAFGGRRLANVCLLKALLHLSNCKDLACQMILLLSYGFINPVLHVMSCVFVYVFCVDILGFVNMVVVVFIYFSIYLSIYLSIYIWLVCYEL